MDKIVLALETRKEAGKSRSLRREGKMPAVVYGKGSETEAVTVDTRMFKKTYNDAGGNKIIGLKIDGERQKNALIHDVQHNSVTGEPLHADFYLIRMDEKIKTDVPLHFTGESTAVYQDEGSLIRPLEAVEVEALPNDLPENFEVDISVLDDFAKTITVADLKVPEGVEILTPPEELVAKVEPPRSDEELEALDEEVTEELPEGVAEEQTAEEEDQPTKKEPDNKADGAGDTQAKAEAEKS